MYAAIGFTAERLRGTYLKQLQRSVNDYDREIIRRPGVGPTFAEASAECFAHGASGLVADAAAGDEGSGEDLQDHTLCAAPAAGK